MHHWGGDKGERKSLSLCLKLGGLIIPIFAESCQIKYENSVKHTEGVVRKSSIRHGNMKRVIITGD